MLMIVNVCQYMLMYVKLMYVNVVPSASQTRHSFSSIGMLLISDCCVATGHSKLCCLKIHIYIHTAIYSQHISSTGGNSGNHLAKTRRSSRLMGNLSVQDVGDLGALSPRSDALVSGQNWLNRRWPLLKLPSSEKR